MCFFVECCDIMCEENIINPIIIYREEKRMFLYVILCILFWVLVLGISFIIIAFFWDVPTELREIGVALKERNEIEKEKLEMMKNKNINTKEENL